MLQDFINKYNNQPIEADGSQPGSSSYRQCVDLVKAYIQEVLGLTPFHDNAIDYATNFPHDQYEFVKNTPKGVPNPGDIVIFSYKPYGHVSVFISGDAKSFQSFDQNFPIGSFCHVQEHDYKYVVGWLHPVAGNAPVPAPAPAPTPEPAPTPTPPPPAPTYPKDVTVEAEAGVHVRQLPNSHSPMINPDTHQITHIPATLKQGTVFLAVNGVAGEDPYGDGRNLWYQTPWGHFVWSGACK